MRGTLLKVTAVLIWAQLVAACGAEVPDSTPGQTRLTFKRISDMNHPHTEHAAALTKDGSLIIIDLSRPNTSELYEPKSGKFRQLNHIMLGTGNLRADGRVCFGEHELIEVTNQSPDIGRALVNPQAMQVQRNDYTTTLLPNGKILITGGYVYQLENGKTKLSIPPDLRRGITCKRLWLTAAELFDPKTGRSVPVAPMLQPRSGFTTTVLPNGVVLLAGGSVNTDNNEKAVASSELFDPNNSSFKKGPPLVMARSHHQATPLNDGRVLLTGGTTNDAHGGAHLLASSEFYNPDTNQFVPGPDMQVGRFRHATTLLKTGDVLVSGGENWAFHADNSSIANVELYDTRRDKFISVGAMISPRSMHQASRLLDGTVLVTGGENHNFRLHESDDTPLNTAETLK